MSWCIFGWNVITARPFWPVRGCWLGLCPQSHVTDKRLIARRKLLSLAYVLHTAPLLAGMAPLMIDFRFNNLQNVIDLVFVLVVALMIMTFMLVGFVDDPEWNRIFMYAGFAKVLLCGIGYMSSVGFTPCGVLATYSATLSVGLGCITVGGPIFLEVIAFEQVSSAMSALQVIIISLALLGAYLMHAYQEITDCPAPGGHTVWGFISPEISLAAPAIGGLAGVFFLGAKVKSLRSARSHHSQVTSHAASVTNDAIITALPHTAQGSDPKVNQDATRFDQLSIIGRRGEREEVMETGQLATVVPRIGGSFTAGNDPDNNEEGDVESLHEAQLDFAEETETQGNPASESTQGEGESDELRASRPAPAIQDAWGDRDTYDPMQWGGAAPAAQCRVPGYIDNCTYSLAGNVEREYRLDELELCSNLSGTTASSIMNPSTVAVHIFGLSGTELFSMRTTTAELHNITADFLKNGLVNASDLPSSVACVRLVHRSSEFSGNRTVLQLLHPTERRPDRDPNFTVNLFMVQVEAKKPQK